jgi:signal transduction histidine kinase
MKVLIADDNAFFRRMLESTLSEWGYEVWAVANGEAAWDALHRPGAPRLAIIDWMMPAMEGPELCRRLRATQAGRSVYVIILTSKEGRADAVAGLQAGADDFVRKPFDREELQARLNVGVRIIGLQEELAEKVKLLEIALSGAQKMEAVGRLAGGVAHDFNNLLTVILGTCELIGLTPQEDTGLAEQLQTIKAAGERGVALTRQLLAFSRRQILQPRTIRLNDVVHDLGKLLPRLTGAQIELVLHLDPDLGYVHADPGQIEQVIMNFAVNARDAMPAGGTLTIETQNADGIEAGDDLGCVHDSGPYVRLSVRDTGHGMDEETKKHVFEPFFTTKEPGKGTGLGLATVYGIVKQSGGFLELDSSPGNGATFSVFLPRVVAATVLPGLDSLPVMRHGSGETILLVEDEQPVRILVKEMLRTSNYHVLEAIDGRHALDVYAKHLGRIDLLVTDLVMPRMGGRVLAEQLTQVNPALKVLFMSGYTDDLTVRQNLEGTGHSYLQKPFGTAALTAKIRAVLHGDRGIGEPREARTCVS